MMCGDFNARTGSENSICNDGEWLTDIQEETFLTRSSEDYVENTSGHQLIELCNVLDCSILNGANDLHFDNAFTYISTTGKSVVDYFVLSNDLCQREFVHTLKIIDRIDSSHMPVTMNIRTAFGNRLCTQAPEKKIEKFVWDVAKEHIFKDVLNSVETQNKLRCASQEIPHSIDNALDLFNDCIMTASQCMKKSFTIENKRVRTKNSWFDHECRSLKRETKCQLQKFRKN